MYNIFNLKTVMYVPRSVCYLNCTFPVRENKVLLFIIIVYYYIGFNLKHIFKILTPQTYIYLVKTVNI